MSLICYLLFTKNVQPDKIKQNFYQTDIKEQVCLVRLLNGERGCVLGNITGLVKNEGRSQAGMKRLPLWWAENRRNWPGRCAAHSHTGADSKWAIIYHIWVSVAVICHPLIAFLLAPFSDTVLQGRIPGCFSQRVPTSGSTAKGSHLRFHRDTW